MRVLFLSLSGNRSPAVSADVEHVLAEGGEAVVVTAGTAASPVPDGATVLDVSTAEVSHPVPRLERVLVLRAPRLLTRSGEAAARAAERLAGQRSARVAGLLRTGAGRVDDASQWVHRRAFPRVYRPIRPFLLWRVARRAVLRSLDVSQFDQVVISDSQSIPLGWHLARRHPGLPVAFALQRASTATGGGST